MRNRIFLLALAGMLAAAIVGAAPAKQLTANVNFAGTQLAVVPAINGTAAHLVVAGPEGLRLERTFGAREPIAVDLTKIMDAQGQPATLADGDYKWELRVYTPAAAMDQQIPETATAGPTAAASPRLDVWVGNGRFKVRGGAIIPIVEEPSGRTPTLPTVESTGGTQTGAIGGGGVEAQGISVTPMTTNPNGNHFSGNLTASGGVGSGCTDGDVDLNNGELLVKHDAPWVTIRDTGNDQLWRFWSGSGPLNLTSSRLNGSSYTYPVNIENDTPTNTLYLDSAGLVGLGTSTPSSFSNVKGLDIVQSQWPAVRLNQTGSGHPFSIYAGGSFLSIFDETGFVEPFMVYSGAQQHALHIGPTGIGFATASPDSQLHVNATTVGSGGGGAASGVHIKQNTAWSWNQPWAFFVEGYTNLGGFRINAVDGQRGFHKAAAGGQFGFSTQGNDPITFTQSETLERMRIAAGGNVGIGTAAPAYPLHMGSGARCTVGGVWTDASSREYKQDIQDLSTEAAEETLEKLTPVTFAYKVAPEEHHVGFIAEDAPELVATADRKGMSALDVVAVLTKVVQEQQKTIAVLSAKVAELEKRR